MIRFEFLRNLRIWNAIFGLRAKKLTGIQDSQNVDTDSLIFTAPSQITFTNPIPLYLHAGKYFMVTSGGGSNNGVLFKTLSISGQILTVDTTVSSAVNFSGSATLDARLGTVINNSSIAKLNTDGNSIFNVNVNAGTSVVEGQGIIDVQADHFHTPSSSGSPLTTKGDIWGYSTENARIPVGPDGYVLTADSAVPLGVAWESPTNGASPGFTWGRSGNVEAGTWLTNDSVPSNVAGRMVSLVGAQVSMIMVSNAAANTFEVGVFEHNGITYTQIGTFSITGARSGSSVVAWPVTSGLELAVQVLSGTAQNIVVALILEGDIT